MVEVQKQLQIITVFGLNQELRLMRLYQIRKRAVHQTQLKGIIH